MTIKGKDYNVKIGTRAALVFEQITHKRFEISSVLDEYVYFYSILVANNDELDFDFNEFIDILDEDPTLLIEYKESLENYAKKMNTILNNGSETDSKKKV